MKKFIIKQKATIEVVEYIEAQDEREAYKLSRNLLNDIDVSTEFQFYDEVVKTEYECEVKEVADMKYWEVSYKWWDSVCMSYGYVKAETIEEANKKFDSQFGYEKIDIKDIKEVSVEEILNKVVK